MTLPFAPRHIAAFVLEHVASGATLLDVGSGRGEVAAALSAAGVQVTAIDPSAKAVDRARAIGVPVRQTSLASFEAAETFDAVLFSMVAHHIQPLGQALDAARCLLKRGGLLLLEDFAVEDADEATAAWFYGTLATLRAVDLSDAEPAALAADIGNPLPAWHRDHGGQHPFNTGAMMLAEIGARFDVCSALRGPYFYRYLAGKASEQGPRHDFGEALHLVETELIRARQLKPLGLRIVAS